MSPHSPGPSPGPWHHSDGYRVVWSHDDQIICHIDGIWDKGVYLQEQTEANGRLLALAFEMRDYIAAIARAQYSDNRDRVADITDVARTLLARMEGDARG